MARYYMHRTMCDVLQEMRDCWKTRNFSPMRGLIEEAQGMANRMEAALGANRDLNEIHKEYLAARKLLRETEEAANNAKAELNIKQRGVAESG